MKFGLDQETIDKIKSVLDQYPQIERVIIYGSRAKGNYRPGSDIDLSLKGKNINLSLLNSISIQLDDLLLPYTFDLCSYAQIDNPEFLAHIDRVGIEF